MKKHWIRIALQGVGALLAMALIAACTDVPPAKSPYYHDNDHDTYWGS